MKLLADSRIHRLAVRCDHRPVPTGGLARSYGMVTEFGTMADPIADKATHRPRAADRVVRYWRSAHGG